MRLIGHHVSAAGGPAAAILNAAKLGENACALFVKNQKQWFVKPLAEQDVHEFRQAVESTGISLSAILPHAGYLINFANPDSEKRGVSIRSFTEEMQRCEQLNLKMLNVHPGSSLGLIPTDEACKLVAAGIDEVLKSTEDVKVIIENTAGQGSCVGSKLEELAMILDNVKESQRLGFCLDTAHLYAAGYDIATLENFLKLIDGFDRLLGLDFLNAMHLNDSKTKLGSRADRHESLGLGEIGWDLFEGIASMGCFDEKPLILETPDAAIWAAESQRLFSVAMRG